MDSTNKRLNFELRAQLVYDAIRLSPHPMTIAEIADSCGLTRSPYLREIVDMLVVKHFVQAALQIGERDRAVVVYWATSAPTT